MNTLTPEGIIEDATVEEILSIVEDLGCNYIKKDQNGDYMMESICHDSSSHKLWFYTESKRFYCYTQCHAMSLYDLVMNVRGIEFTDALRYVANHLGITLTHNKRKLGFSHKSEDHSFLDLHFYKGSSKSVGLPLYNKEILSNFHECYPNTWEKEGIDEYVAEQFDIRYYFAQNCAIIPHLDINGNLVGIRKRNFNEWEIANGRKYMPITFREVTYKHNLHLNLYGIYENQDAIRRHKRVILVESEKAVMQYNSMYGSDNGIALAVCGSGFGKAQCELLLSLDVNEVVLAFDKEYMTEWYDNTRTKEYRLMINYFKKLKKITNMLINYCNVSVILSWDNELELKDSPLDRGKETFEVLYKNRTHVNDVEEFDELME